MNKHVKKYIIFGFAILVKMSQTSPTKNPWLGPQTYGFGFGPRTWQGWLTIALFILIESLIVPISAHIHPAWFKARVSGYGWDPATLQGLVATISPVALFLTFAMYMYFNQRKTQKD